MKKIEKKWQTIWEKEKIANFNQKNANKKYNNEIKIEIKNRENYSKKYGEYFFNDTYPVLIVHNKTLNYKEEGMELFIKLTKSVLFIRKLPTLGAPTAKLYATF